LGPQVAWTRIYNILLLAVLKRTMMFYILTSKHLDHTISIPMLDKTEVFKSTMKN